MAAPYTLRGDGPCSGPGMERAGGSPESLPKRLEKLHAELKLAPEQEAAWKAWSDPIGKQAAAMGDMRSERGR